MFGGTYQRAPLPPHWVYFRRRKEKKKKRHPMCANHFHGTQNKSSQLFLLPLPFQGGSESTNRYHKSPVLVSYGSRSKLRYIVPLTDKSVSPPSDKISDYLCYKNNVRLLMGAVWWKSGKGVSGSPELHLICCCLWVRGIVE